jgi:hypothetical protein
LNDQQQIENQNYCPANASKTQSLSYLYFMKNGVLITVRWKMQSGNVQKEKEKSFRNNRNGTYQADRGFKFRIEDSWSNRRKLRIETVICPVFCKSDELCEKQTPSETEKSS